MSLNEIITAIIRCFSNFFIMPAFHSMFAANSTNKSVCVIADDIYILIPISTSCGVTLHVRQDTESITM